MVDSERKLDRDARWWMGCQPHIRALREAMHSTTSHKDVEELLRKCVSLYMATINYNLTLEDEKISTALSGRGITAMEASFTWLGGWRPSSALLLVYSLMAVQLEDEICNFGYGIRDLTNTSAILSHKQLTNLTNVQKSTRGQEKKLSKKLAHIQMLLSDQDVLAAVMQVESSASRSSSSSSSSSETDLRTVLKRRMSRLKKLLIQADQLRLHTLHQLFLVLTPAQVARCAIAAFELAFMMRELGNSTHHQILQAAIPASSSARPYVFDSSNALASLDHSRSDVVLHQSRTTSSPLPSCSSEDCSPSVEEECSDGD